MSTLAAPRAYRFSMLTAAALAIQAAGGVFIPGLYRDNAWVSSVLRGQDAMSLALVLPVLVVAHLLARRGSVAGRLVWIGTLYKVFYNNLYLLVGSDFNRCFLTYVAVFICSSMTVVAALVETDIRTLDAWGVSPARRKVAAGILIAAGGLLTVLWVGQSLQYLVTGVLPQLVIDGGGGTHLVAAFDLTLVVPPTFIGAIWLLRGRPWGLVVAAGMHVQGILIVMDLIVTPAFQAAAGVANAYQMVPVWVVMGIGFVAGAVLLLGGRARVARQAA
jgi:hypothetical protein